MICPFFQSEVVESESEMDENNFCNRLICNFFQRKIVKSSEKQASEIELYGQRITLSFPTKKLIKDKCKLSPPKLRLKISRKTFKDDDL